MASAKASNLHYHQEHAVRSQAWFSPFDSLKQYMLKALFLDDQGNADPKLAVKAMNEYSGNGEGSILKQQFDSAKKCLTERGIRFFDKTEAAIFFWLDLREYLDKVPPPCGEVKLYCRPGPRECCLEEYIRVKAKVALIPGQECFNEEPGYFRLCYTAEKENQVLSGINRLAEALKKLS